MATVEQLTVQEATTPVGAKRKRSSVVAKGLSLKEMAAKIKQLQDSADKAEGLIAEKEQEKEKYVAQFDALIAGMRAEAASKQAEARKAAQVYARMEYEEELAKLESSVPKRPNNPFLMFTVDIRTTAAKDFDGLHVTEVNKKISTMWKEMGETEKKVYTDKFAQENKKYREWEETEEGRKTMSALSAIRIKMKASEKELMGVDQSGATPPKQQRSTPAVTAKPEATAKPTAPVESSFDEKVMLEAEKAGLVGQLRNLAGRPEVRALNKTDADLLAALKASGGMVNAAKRSLFGEQ